MMVWGSNFKHSSVRLEETIYFKYLCNLQKINTTEYKHLKTGSSMISWRASARKRVFSVSPFYITSIYGLGKAANPPDISWLASVNFSKFLIPPPLSFELETMSQIFPCPGVEKPIHPLVFPDIFPWLARGSTPGASR